MISISSNHKLIILFIVVCSGLLVFSLFFLQSEEEGVVSRQLREEKQDVQKHQKELEKIEQERLPHNKQENEREKKQQEESNEKEENKGRPAIDLEDFPNLVGPRSDPVEANKSLVAICIGKSDKVNVNKLVKFFPAPQFTLMLFHYDNSTWDEFEWYNSLNVIAIRILHKMKYWYVKRFIYPELARSFSHIIILDADVSFSEATFNAPLYLSIVDTYNIALSQPSHDYGSVTAHEILLAQDGDAIGRYTDFIECGPAVVLSQKGYLCVYDLMQSDLTSGWGLDLKWANYVRFTCGLGNQSVAVLDNQNLHHALESGKGTASSKPGFNDGAWKEYYTYRDRFPGTPSTQKIENGSFGSRACIGKNTTFPHNCFNATQATM